MLVGAKKPVSFISATGGTETTDGNYKIHTFSGNGTFTVNSVGSGSAESDVVDYLVVAGGGGGAYYGGGGGAGGYRTSTGFTVTATGYSITVGGGGSGSQPMLEQAAVQVVVEGIPDQVEAQVIQGQPEKEMLVVQTMTAVEQVDHLAAVAAQVQLAQQHLAHKEETVVLDQLVL